VVTDRKGEMGRKSIPGYQSTLNSFGINLLSRPLLVSSS
jgi:hypothetical protein